MKIIQHNFILLLNLEALQKYEFSSVRFSCSVVSDSLRPHGLYSSWNSPDQNTGAGSLSLLHGIFPTQEIKLGSPALQTIPYQLSYQGSLRQKVQPKQRPGGQKNVTQARN